MRMALVRTYRYGRAKTDVGFKADLLQALQKAFHGSVMISIFFTFLCDQTRMRNHHVHT